MQDWIQVVGRAHPMVLHLPIGLLAALATVEAMMLVRRDEALLRAARVLAALTGASALLAALTGYILSGEGGYDAETMGLHLRLGLAFAFLSAATALVYVLGCSAVPRRVGVVLSALVLLPAGHLGASMTHGENFLFEPLAARHQSDAGIARSDRTPRLDAEPGTTSQPTDGGPYAAIEAIFQTRCVACHGITKRKGGLALHTPTDVMAGGEDGPVIVPGDPGSSELIRRIMLAEQDKERMPPRGKPGLSPEQISVLRDWIASGAPTAGGLAGHDPGSPPPDLAGELEDADAAATQVDQPAPASSEAIAALRARLVHVEPLSAGSSLLVVSFGAVAPGIDDAAAADLLTPIQENVADLSLARSAVTDATLTLIRSMSRLRRLDLRATRVSEKGLAMLEGHGELMELVLAQTELVDDAVESLLRLPRLAHVYLWKSGISEAGIQRLRGRDGLYVDAGDRLVTDAAEAESELKLSGDAPLPGSSATPPPVATLKPTNTVCPVSGNPVNPKYAVVHEGRVIGFCCPNCPKDFWADPAKYESKLK
ncbi:MAG: c-type cytochrome [Phycisphaerae bacterium]|nr:c-type cytochrome [Phycisphaerae bacterium]